MLRFVSLFMEDDHPSLFTVTLTRPVQVEDVQRVLECLAIDKGKVWTCIGVSGVDGMNNGGDDGDRPEDLHGHLPPALPVRR